MNRVRDQVRDGHWPARYIAIFDHLVFRARPHGRDRCQVSYATMARNLRIRRATLVAAIRDFEAEGLLHKLHTRVRAAWQGIWASRKGSNIYVFACLPTEFRRRPTIREVRKQDAQEQGILAHSPAPGRVSAMLEGALVRLGQRVKEAPS